MRTKDFTAIDPAALDAVTGGRRSSSTRSDTDDRLFQALDDIKTALGDLGKQQAKPASSGLDQLLPMLMMQLMNRNGTGTGGGFGGGNGCGGGRY